MKRFLLMLLAMLFISSAHAQNIEAKATFGFRIEALPNALASGDLPASYPVLGTQLGFELGGGQWWGGFRVGFSSLFILSVSLQWELYGRYVLENADSVVLGFGKRLSGQLFLWSGWEDWHALLGYHFASNFFFEALPGVAIGSQCPQTIPGGCTTVYVPIVTLSFGLIWRF